MTVIINENILYKELYASHEILDFYSHIFTYETLLISNVKKQDALYVRWLSSTCR